MESFIDKYYEIFKPQYKHPGTLVDEVSVIISTIRTHSNFKKIEKQ